MVAGGYVYKFNTTVTANNIYIYTYVTLLLFANYTAVVNTYVYNILINAFSQTCTHARMHTHATAEQVNKLVRYVLTKLEHPKFYYLLLLDQHHTQNPSIMTASH